MDREDREHFKTMNSASAEPQAGSRSASSAKGSQASRPDPAYCLASAKRIFSCYRRDEAQDPEGYVANLALVLGDYPRQIIDLAADPRTGVITAFPMGVPNLGQIGEFLAGKLAYQEKMERLAALPKVERTRYLPRPEPQPGDLANVFLPITHPLYSRMVERAKDGCPREYRHEPNGIRVALGWLERPSQEAKHFKTPAPTDDELRAIYAKQVAEERGQDADAA